MRFIHTADLHLKAGSNILLWQIKDQKKCLGKIISYMRKEEIVDLIISGDVFDRHNPDYDTQSLFLNWVEELLSYDKRVWVIPGNHDASNHNNSVHSMSIMRKSLSIGQGGGSGSDRGFHIIDTVHTLKNGPFIGYTLYFVPWMSDENLNRALKRVAGEVEGGTIPILVTHCFVSGSTIGDRGIKLSNGINSKVFDPFVYAALGDVHLRQEFKTERGFAYYPGSLFINNFGERREKKGFLDVDVRVDLKGTNRSKIIFVPTPHIKWIQRKVTASVLSKIMDSDTLLKRKFPKNKIKGRNVKMVIDCKGSARYSKMDITRVIQFFRETLEAVDFTFELKNVGHKAERRFKSKKTSNMISEMVDSDDAVKGKRRKARTKKVGKSILSAALDTLMEKK